MRFIYVAFTYTMPTMLTGRGENHRAVFQICLKFPLDCNVWLILFLSMFYWNVLKGVISRLYCRWYHHVKDDVRVLRRLWCTRASDSISQRFAIFIIIVMPLSGPNLSTNDVENNSSSNSGGGHGICSHIAVGSSGSSCTSQTS
jgi:hypothetical protein